MNELIMEDMNLKEMYIQDEINRQFFGWNDDIDYDDIFLDQEEIKK